jgi:hypothetical protein
MEEDTAPALPVRPMDSRPMTFPSRGLSSLSEDARTMYAYGRAPRLNRDVFDPKTRNRFVTAAEAKLFQPTDRMMAAIRELEDAQLGRYSNSRDHSLSVTEIHEHYTVAYGRGSQLITVKTFTDHPDEAELLAVLVGGDLESREASVHRLHEVAVRSRHADATDFEHDASSTAQLVVRNPTLPVFAGYGQMRFHGVLTEAHLYPLGAFPLQQSDEDTRYDGEPCDSCKTPHPYAPYLPPKAAWLQGPVFVIVETLPLRPYLVAAQPAAAS